MKVQNNLPGLHSTAQYVEVKYHIKDLEFTVLLGLWRSVIRCGFWNILLFQVSS